MATGDSSADPTTFCPARVPNATIYSPLDPGQIRVLHLQPARKLTAPLVGVFETIQIGSDAGYEALSYTWDEAFEEPKVSKLRSLKSSIRKSWMQESIFSTYKVKRGEIRIHEVAVATTANLHVALRRLRYSRKARTLWVDAICINQGDLVERSTQVACMEQIFSGASQVVAWIGEDSAIQDGRHILRYCRQNEESLKHILYYLSSRFDGEGKLLDVFEHRRYFRRRWCIQEVAFAQSAMLKCGALEIPWSTFINALGVDLSFDRDTIGTLSKIPEERHAIRLMTMLSPWKCLDKRDVIYSVASILKLCPDCPQIMIDYSLDWPTVYTRFTRDYIQLNGYIAAWNILITAGLHLSSPSRCRRLPHASETHSWVPDWADFDQGGWLSQTHIRYNLLGHRYYIYGNNKKVVCDDHSIKIDLQYLGQMGISRASDKELLWNDCYYHLLTEWTSVQQYVVLILRRCGEQDMTFQLVGCEFPAPCEWDMEPEVHRVTII